MVLEFGFVEVGGIVEVVKFDDVVWGGMIVDDCRKGICVGVWGWGVVVGLLNEEGWRGEELFIVVWCLWCGFLKSSFCVFEVFNDWDLEGIVVGCDFGLWVVFDVGDDMWFVSFSVVLFNC